MLSHILRLALLASHVLTILMVVVLMNLIDGLIQYHRRPGDEHLRAELKAMRVVTVMLVEGWTTSLALHGVMMEEIDKSHALESLSGDLQEE